MFLSELVKLPLILIIFGKKMAKRIELCEMHSFSTTSNLRRYSVIFVNENENGEKRKNNEFVNEN